MLKSRSLRLNLGLTAGVLILIAVPLAMLREAEFSGADNQAQDAITALHPNYKPWTQPIFKPASSVESLLFAAQAAFGAGMIGYVMGWYRGRQEARTDASPSPMKNRNPN
ncbi:energy-coupling factor ABC transporter substrate-binding protein [Synechococcus sp. PCC 6312]|uniref:energy-coupling factor ABC transporter substrate-binding protein n=1 Tax=Synechococcus sp. (strain ATCC 27167 / PCC 6312) TaxID=195253 RepID=UPI00029F25F9|nr:energy-coupling factor ABC transporter substrate-binding protein [Synechococcus sp. PCC 6312]AFY59391.1 ABC-type cobalt transport system, periplasmic component [Synechococcus sp. PCC 6312]